MLSTNGLIQQHWGEGRPYLVAANVGVFSQTRVPAIVPDLLLSLDVTVAQDWWSKAHRSYFIWEFGKPPDLVLEIVSTTAGRENAEKRLDAGSVLRNL